jgi:hypothetical protein
VTTVSPYPTITYWGSFIGYMATMSILSSLPQTVAWLNGPGPSELTPEAFSALIAAKDTTPRPYTIIDPPIASEVRAGFKVCGSALVRPVDVTSLSGGHAVFNRFMYDGAGGGNWYTS